MLPITRWFGVTFSDDERNLEAEKAYIDEIVERVLRLQAKAAAEQHRPLARGTHAKGVVTKAKFEVFGAAVGRDPALAARLAKGIFAKPGVYRDGAVLQRGPSVIRLQARCACTFLLRRSDARRERSSGHGNSATGLLVAEYDSAPAQ